jgi:hypothetical protein
VVPEAGLEPARCCHRQILSLYGIQYLPYLSSFSAL